MLGDPDQPHTYTYIPDIGEGLAILGEHPEASGSVWHLPHDPDTRTTRKLSTSSTNWPASAAARFRTMPPLLLRALGVVNPTIRELSEMQYQFEEPFVDSSRIAKKLGAEATPLQQALTETPETYRDRTLYGRVVLSTVGPSRRFEGK